VKNYVTEKPVTFLHETNHVCAVAGLPTLSSSKQARKKQMAVTYITKQNVDIIKTSPVATGWLGGLSH